MDKPGNITGMIFKIKRFAVHDGPGIRTAVFLKGCPLNCVWCHSPEGIDSKINLWYNRNICILCGRCVDSCPENALTLKSEIEKYIDINRKSCSLSGDCINVCPTGAILFTGRQVSVGEVIIEIEKDELYYRQSGGGITLTGGEPLFQPEFSKAVLQECIKLNIHTAIETSLSCQTDTLADIAQYVDLFIVDMKISDNEKHIKHTGKGNEMIMQNFRYLASSGKEIIVRIPLIPDITDTEKNKAEIIEFVNSFNRFILIEYLEYNPLAENNYKRLNIQFPLKTGI
jgi:pyruvate formate lyase activating enzyme